MDQLMIATRRKFNKELQDELGISSVISFITWQRIQWLEHVMRRSDDDISRTILNWKPMRKRSEGDSGKSG